MSYADCVRGKGLVLITGKKGSGKSHFATRIIKDIMDSNQDGQYNVYSNITGLKIDGVLPAPDSWLDVPNNSIIFYDEAQLLKWADNSNTKISSDKRVSSMTLIRKQNKHIVLMTQDPTFIHSALRKLVDYHYHLSHPFKDGKPKVFYFHGALTNIDDKGTWKTHAQEEFFYKLDKEINDLYQSIDDDSRHDQKYKIPRKIILLRILTVVFLCLSLFLLFNFAIPIIKKFISFDHVKKAGDSSESSSTSVVSHVDDSVSVISRSKSNPNNDLNLDYVAEERKRIYITAQKMIKEKLSDDYTVIQSEPALQVRGVIMMGSKCHAYNTYGDLMSLPLDECNYYLENVGRVHKSRSVSRSEQGNGL